MSNVRTLIRALAALGALLAAALGCGRDEATPAPAAGPSKPAPVAEPSAPAAVAVPPPKAGTMGEFPEIQGEYALTREWSLVLAAPVKKRIEDGSLVLWRPGFTVWLNVWGNDDGPPAAQLAAVKADASPRRFDAVEETTGGALRFAYRLREGADDERRPAFYGFVLGESGYVQMAIYFDDEVEIAAATALWRSVHETAPR
jgi:hypothetical protein